ncbi:MAG: tol-pal system-associated acyl-CoA thioesterase [Rhodobacteraceae bacterium]|nr:tol-pal system-associated acyl-CoA thioesterase [Paracoccaceae bacterium]
MIYTHHLRVYYEDTDMAGIVYYANYLKFTERGRSDAVRDMEIDQNAMKADGYVFAVKSVQAEYHTPARFGDELRVETETSKLGGASLEMSQRVLRGDDLVFSAVFRVACMDMAGKAVRFPADIRQKLQKSLR